MIKMADDTDPGDESPSERTAIRRRSVQSREEPTGFARYDFVGFFFRFFVKIN